MSVKSFIAACIAFAVCILMAVLPTSAQTAQDDYARLLKTYVHRSADGVNLVDYASWQGNDADRAALSGYLEYLHKQKPSQMPRDEAFVFWINLYNAATLNAVLENYPVDSIRDIKSEGTSLLDFKAFFGPWRTKLTTIEGEKHSLDDIEHDIIRPTYKDARSHYALNCASLGCPNLKITPWWAETLEADLEVAAAEFINHPRGVKVQPDGALMVSSIYEWFRDDFGGSDQAVIAHLRKYAKPELAVKLKGRPRIGGHSYDWTLNEQTSSTAVH
ncbi:MAG TPA: DUF547 domain-containing protein [Hyphomicrobiales bacterium]|nr:DUF547 domain-containing protein [Hyphomicrobiales bacterium]